MKMEKSSQAPDILDCQTSFYKDLYKEVNLDLTFQSIQFWTKMKINCHIKVQKNWRAKFYILN